MKFEQPPKKENKSEGEHFFKERIKLSEKLSSIDESKFKGQMIGSIPGLESEDIIIFNKKITEFFNSINFDVPSKIVANLFKLEDDFDWIRDALLMEDEKENEEKQKNLELKKYLGHTIQNFVDSLCAMLSMKKTGYLLNLIMQKYVAELGEIGRKFGMEISDHAMDFGPGGNMENVELSLLLGSMPSVRDTRLKRETFINKNEVFRIKADSVDKKMEDGGWKQVEEIREYTYINPDLVTSKNIINLMSFDDFLQSNYDLPLSDLSFSERIYLYNFLLSSNLYQFHKFMLAYNQQGSNPDLLRTFLSIEYGGKEMGSKIVLLGEKLSETVAQKVFQKYGEIIDAADRAEEEVKNIYDKENISTETYESIKETLLKRGAKLLSDLADNINKGEKISEKEIIEKLEEIRTLTIIMGSAYVELCKEGIKIPIEEIKHTSVEKISGEDLSDKDKEEIIKVYENGRPSETYENKAHLKLLVDEFRETLNRAETFVFNVKFEGKIIAFATFYKENEDTLHVGGLTFVDEARNPAMAVAVLNSIMSEFGDFNLKALVHSKNKILPMYQKRFGFKITGELPAEENAGEIYYEIERPKMEKYKMAA
ncbi:MAG TPA: hypothetical protein VFQ59_01740 [Candidatus Paceibacterota bacterium]|nr:hypothetical protein [Candidatus Paceibacterota bacterium]